MIVASDGLRWITDEDGVDGRLGPENHEAVLASHFVTEGVFLDIGADVGRWSLRVAATASHVYAVEPYRPRRDRIRANAVLNGVANLTLIACGAWDCWTADTLGRTGHIGDPGDLVPLAPLDDVLDPIALDLVKIDVEGFEAKALAGMACLLDRHHPRIVLELHDRLYGEHVRVDTFAELARHDYQVEHLANLAGQDYYLCV